MHLSNLDATVHLAQTMRAHLRPGDVILLDGPVGVGKSAFARALIQSAMAQNGGMVEPVPSPTFTLVQVYQTPCGTFWHTDLYRLSHSDELAELGLDMAFDTAITLVEWPERLGAATPDRHLRLQMDYDATPDGRQITLLPSGPDWDWIEDMQRSLS